VPPFAELFADSSVRPDAAERLAGELLEPYSTRWSRTRAVVRLATDLTMTVEIRDRQTLLAAAWLHDIGSVPALADTGFPALDAAHHLERLGWPRRLIGLIAHHSGARFAAHARFLDVSLDAYPREISPVSDALAYADLHVGLTGGPRSLDEAVTWALRRYPTGSPEAVVHRRWADYVREIEQRVDRRRDVRG
jgi:predicted HD phosphohydrolase